MKPAKKVKTLSDKGSPESIRAAVPDDRACWVDRASCPERCVRYRSALAGIVGRKPKMGDMIAQVFFKTDFGKSCAFMVNDNNLPRVGR